MKEKRASIIPTMQYRDAKAAIDWLCQAFGFERHLVVQGENDAIAHAQLTYGGSMVMLGTKNDNEYGRFIKTPESIHGVNTQAPYIVVEEIDRHYERAVAAGAEIVLEIKDEDYGGRGYTCRDKEGHIWNFGSYDPWSADN